MIIDNVIDEFTARYFCAVDAHLIKDAIAQAKKFSKEESSEKTGIQMAIAVGPEAGDKIKDIEKKLDESQLNEGFFKSVYDFLFNSPPAWVEEPTGFNLSAPKDVFKDDVAGGIAGYNKGAKMATATAATAIGASIPAVRNAAAQVGKTAIKHPVASAVSGLAVANLDTTVEIAKNARKDLSAFGKMLNACKPAIDKVCGLFKPLVDFFKEHPIFASTIGAIGYGLLKTYPIWWPYMRRLSYEITSGKTLARVDFEANDSSYTFEYTANKNKWVLLNAGKVASIEDSTTFVKTKFAQRFIKQVKKNFEALFSNKDVVLAQASLVGGEKLVDAFKKFFESEKIIRSNMFTQKMMFEECK